MDMDTLDLTADPAEDDADRCGLLPPGRDADERYGGLQLTEILGTIRQAVAKYGKPTRRRPTQLPEDRDLLKKLRIVMDLRYRASTTMRRYIYSKAAYVIKKRNYQTTA